MRLLRRRRERRYRTSAIAHDAHGLLVPIEIRPYVSTALPQVKTVPFTVKSIMSTDEFERGFRDARKGRPFDWRIGGDDIDAASDYERGRLLAHLAPLDMPLWINGSEGRSARLEQARPSVVLEHMVVALFLESAGKRV